MKHIATIFDVAERHLCSGCGACAGIAPDEVRMVDDESVGMRPVAIASGDGAKRALAACPGVRLELPPFPAGTIAELDANWGPVLQMWEGYATSSAVRFGGSSGGAATALATFALERGFAGVLHVGASESDPWRNRTVFSTSATEVVQHVGSRYSPASPVEGIPMLMAADSPSVMIGKPCDVAGVTMATGVVPGLDRKLGLTIGVFCAGTPSTQGTLEMLKAMEVDDPSAVRSLRYRGHGWPGNAVAVVQRGEHTEERSLSYDRSWGEILQRHRPWRCMICPDHTGEFADISVGDPWWRPTGDDPGRSLILARTERGRSVVLAAIEAGVLTVEPADPAHLPMSQEHLLRTRGAVWGRLFTMRLLRLPTLRLVNIDTWTAWRTELTLRQRAASVIGTARRIRSRRLHRPRPVVPPPDRAR